METYEGGYREGTFVLDVLVAPFIYVPPVPITGSTEQWCRAPLATVQAVTTRSWQRRQWLIQGKKSEREAAQEYHNKVEERACCLGCLHPREWNELDGTDGRRED